MPTSFAHPLATTSAIPSASTLESDVSHTMRIAAVSFASAAVFWGLHLLARLHHRLALSLALSTISYSILWSASSHCFYIFPICSFSSR
jgi:hypothetical protein